MQVRKYDEKENLIFAHVINAGDQSGSEYDAVYDEEAKALHIYDDFSHRSTSIVNNIRIKDDVLEELGYSDGFIQSFLNKIDKKAPNSRVRMFIYMFNLVWEVTREVEFAEVEDVSLLHKPFYDKVLEYSRSDKFQA